MIEILRSEQGSSNNSSRKIQDIIWRSEKRFAKAGKWVRWNRYAAKSVLQSKNDEQTGISKTYWRK